MKCLIQQSNKVKVNLEQDEYIPLKIIYERGEEPVDNISYSKGTRSLLEISIGIQSKLINKITLLLSEKYYILDKKINIDKLESVIGDIVFREYESVESGIFITKIFKDGLKIIISGKKSAKYVKMDMLYIGLSNTYEITEIIMDQLNEKEINHIKNELDLQ